MNGNTKQQFGSLNLLRGCAALMVVLWHVPGVEGHMLSSGGLAVDLFFLISGFIIAHAYERSLLRRSMSFGRFFTVRLTRLYPLYAVGMLLGLCAAIFTIYLSGVTAAKLRHIVPSTVLAIFMLPRPEGDKVGSFRLNVPAWSLFFEVLVNLVYAAILPRLTNRRLVLTVLASGVAILILQLIFGRFNFGDVGWQMFLAFPRVVFSYGLGCLIYRYWSEGKLPCIIIPTWLLPAIFILVIWVPPSVCPVWATQLAAVTLIFPTMLVTAIGSEARGATAALAKHSGELSYSLYMVHYPIITIAYVGVEAAVWTARVAYPLAVVLALLLSYVFDRLYDRRMQAWLRLRLLRHPVIDQAAAPAFP